MITAVDTSVLLDVFGADPEFGPRSRAALRSAGAQGQLVAGEVVWAEVTSFFRTPRDAARALDRIGVAFTAIESETAAAAGAAWKEYRSRGGRRTRVIADFLVGAHALQQAERLLTRDRGFYRSYFSRLSVLDPSTPPS